MPRPGASAVVEDSVAGQLNAIEGTSRGLELVAGKWTILVVFELARESRRLSDLRRTILDASPKMLIHTLRKLESHGLVQRTVHPVVPPRVEYALTPMGRSLLEPLLVLCEWVDQNWPQMLAAANRHDGVAAEHEG
jgi:DNA-binding HxlR family transcriptional regulator